MPDAPDARDKNLTQLKEAAVKAAKEMSQAIDSDLKNVSVNGSDNAIYALVIDQKMIRQNALKIENAVDAALEAKNKSRSVPDGDSGGSVTIDVPDKGKMTITLGSAENEVAQMRLKLAEWSKPDAQEETGKNKTLAAHGFDAEAIKTLSDVELNKIAAPPATPPKKSDPADRFRPGPKIQVA